MPLLKGSIKANKQNIKKRKRNASIRRDFKVAYKTVIDAIEKKDFKVVKEFASKAFSELDKALKKNLLKKNTVARRKARIHNAIKLAGEKEIKFTAMVKKAVKAVKKAVPTKKPAAKKTTTKKAAPKKAAPKKK